MVNSKRLSEIAEMVAAVDNKILDHESELAIWRKVKNDLEIELLEGLNGQWIDEELLSQPVL